MLKMIGDLEVKSMRMTLQLANRSIKYSYGVVENVIVKVDKLLFPMDFVVMETRRFPWYLADPSRKLLKLLLMLVMESLKWELKMMRRLSIFFRFCNILIKGLRIDTSKKVFLGTKKQLHPSNMLEKVLQVLYSTSSWREERVCTWICGKETCC